MTVRIKPKKIVIVKDNQLAVYKEIADAYCDFCGTGEGARVFTSSFDDCENSHKCNMQICEECVKQLSKFIKK